METDFSYAGYRAILDVLARDRTCPTFGELRDGLPDGRVLILRHDIDMSLDAALRMAEIEAAIGVRATYFLLFSSAWYNLLGADGIGAPGRLHALGHEVGLHYDARVMSDGDADPERRLEEQARLLSGLAGAPVRSIAMHNPSTSGEDPFVESRFVSAYEPRFAEDIAYYSDSCGAWRDEFVARLHDGRFPDAVQLLIHPVFWGETHRDRWETLDAFLSGDLERRRALAADIRALWERHSGVREHDAREGREG